MPKVQLILTGDEKLNRRLAALQKNDAKKAMRTAARFAMNRLLPRIKAATPYRTGLLRKSMRVRAIQRSRRQIGVKIGTSSKASKKLFGGKTFYGSFIEFGKTVKGVKNQGAYHMIEGTTERHKERILRYYYWELGKEIDKVVNRTQ